MNNNCCDNFCRDISRVVSQVIKDSVNPQNGHGIGGAMTHIIQHAVYPPYGNYNLENQENTSAQNLVYREVFIEVSRDRSGNQIKYKMYNKHRHYNLNHKHHEYCEPNCGCDGNYYSHSEYHKYCL